MRYVKNNDCEARNFINYSATNKQLMHLRCNHSFVRIYFNIISYYKIVKEILFRLFITCVDITGWILNRLARLVRQLSKEGFGIWRIVPLCSIIELWSNVL